jgi:hypothetical protein
VLVGLNDRNPQLHDLYRADLKSGKRELLQENPGVAALMADDDFDVRLAFTYTPDGGQAWLLPEGGRGEKGYGNWKPMVQITPADALTSGPVGFDKTGDVLYYQDSRDRNTAALFGLNLNNRESELIAENDKADVGGVLAHPTEKNIQAVSFTFARREWKVLDESIRGDLDF